MIHLLRLQVFIPEINAHTISKSCMNSSYYYSVEKNEQFLQRMDLEGIMLCAISQKGK